MFFSHHGAKKNRALVRRAGFELEEAVVEAEPEDRHDALFLWVVARRPSETSMTDDRSGHPGPDRRVRCRPSIREAIVAQARAEYPNEACGVDHRRRARGRRWPGAPLRADPERAASPYRYEIDPDDLLRLTIETDDADEVFWGIVHSHTHTPAVPSPTDIGLARSTASRCTSSCR